MTVGKTKIAGILLILLILLMNSQAQTNLADWHYELALSAYQSDDCINASAHVSRAFDRYSLEDDPTGVAKCNDLIEKVNDCLRLIGDHDYLQAIDHISKGDQYLNSGDYTKAREQFDSAAVYLQRANYTYQHMLPWDPERIAKVDAQYLQISAKIREGELMNADELYNKALRIIEDNDFYTQYLTALSYLHNASTICDMYNDTRCIQDCETLRKTILRQVDTTAGPETDDLYKKGIIEYQKANCTNDAFFEALDYFDSAKNIYLLENNYERVEDCETIMDMTKEKISECAEGMLETVEEAKRAFLLPPETLDCGSRYNHTMEYYYTLIEDINNIKEEIEKTYEITGNEALKEKIDELNTLTERIKQKKEECTKINETERSYLEAVELFQEAEYEQALGRIEQAEENYRGIQDYVGVTKCEQLKEEILKANETKSRADQYYEEALRYMEYKDYGTAREFGEQARDLYRKIGYLEGVEKTETLLAGYEPSPGLYWLPECSFIFICSVTIAFIVWNKKVRHRT